jgi:hypothetical protein
MHVAIVIDRAASGDQRLRRNLTTEDALHALVGRMPSKEIDLKLFDAKEFDEVVKDLSHAVAEATGRVDATRCGVQATAALSSPSNVARCGIPELVSGSKAWSPSVSKSRRQLSVGAGSGIHDPLVGIGPRLGTETSWCSPTAAS